jgi:hypothetical protein
MQLWDIARLPNKRPHCLWYAQLESEGTFITHSRTYAWENMQLGRAAELTKERIKTLENPSASSTEVSDIRQTKTRCKLQTKSRSTYQE